MTNIDYSRNNGADTLTVSLNSPLTDVLDHMTDTYTDTGLLLEDLQNYGALVVGTIGEAVRRARAEGMSWERIGSFLGMSRQSAWERWGQ